MSTQVQRRKGTTVQHSTFTGASAELTVDTTKNTVVVHDGATAGGIPLAKETGSAISATSLTSSGASVINVSSASPALRITQSSSGDSLVVEDSTNPDSTPFIIDNNGKVIAGYTSIVAPDLNNSSILPQMNVVGTSSNAQYAAFSYINAPTNSALLTLSKSRGAAVGVNTIVSSGDTIGIVKFTAADGTAFVPAASISAQVDGTPGTNDMPGRLVFSTTADGASSPTERMRITSTGNVGVGTNAPAVEFEVSSATGSATPVPTEIRISNTTSASDWSTTLPWGRLSFYSADLSDAGSKIHGAVDMISDIANGGRSSMAFNIAAATTGTLTERMRLDASGNLGIGTSSPAAKLDVVSGTGYSDIGIQSTGGFKVRGDGRVDIGGVTGQNAFLGISRPSGSSISTLIYGENKDGKSFQLSADATGVSLVVVGTTGLLTFGSTGINSQQLVINTATGNVGIGTNSPSYKLDVYGSGTPVAAVRSSATGDAKLYLECAGTNSGYVSYNRSLQALTFSANNSTNHAILDSAGNLGLGVVPSAWNSSFKAFELANSGAAVSSNGGNRIEVGTGSYINSAGNPVYTVTGTAVSKYVQVTGINQWFQAPAGTAGNAITFTQAMTLDASGNLLVGTTSGIGRIGAAFPNSQYGFTASCSSASGTAIFNRFLYNTSTEVGSISSTGSVTLYNTTSDQRLKENIVDAPEFGSVIDSIKVRSYDWKTDQTHQRAGFIAQELVAVAPEAVHQPENPEEMMAVDYSKLVPMLVKEIQDLRKRLAAANL